MFSVCIDPKTYNGTLNVTLKGYTCQRWDSQHPHMHNWNFPDHFPNDASLYDAHNYCRNPDGTGMSNINNMSFDRA